VFTAVAASSRRHVLAEGPVWVAESATILWIDVEAGHVFEGRLEGDRVEETRKLEFDGRVGAAVPGVHGSILVATADRLVVVPPRGGRLDGPIIVPPGVQSRTNDGACDPAGRFLVGTLALDGRTGDDGLYRVEDDGTLTSIDADLTLSNGLGWSPDGRLLYSTDTVPQVIWVRDYDAQTGTFGERREHLKIEDGLPDGLCVDSRGYLWVAIWGSGEVRSFTPDGELATTVTVPTPHPSSVAFVGDDLDLLLITSASRDLSEADLVRYPDAGRLFIARVGTTGTPTFPWSESWLSRAVGNA
jgi:sugar lactone lactonase YvrE